MNILVVSQYYYPEPFRVNEICEVLVNRGHKVTVVTGIPNYPDGEIYPGYESAPCEERINGVRVIRCRIRPRKTGNKNLALNYLSFVFAAEKVLKKLDGEFDIVYGYQLSPVTSMLPARWLAKRKKVPFYLYCLDVWPESIEAIFPKGRIIYRIVAWVSKNIYASATVIGVTSPCFKSYLSELLGKSDNICFLPQHCTDIIPEIQKELNKTLTKKETIDFLFVGNIGSSQNVEGVIRALSKVNNRNLIRLHIVGSGSSLENVKEECRIAELEETVAFYGRQPKKNLAQYYQNADVCIVSLRKEGIVGNTIPGKLQEYMSAGKAILAFIDGDAAWVVREANCGITVPAEDEQSLVEAFTCFLDKEKISIWGRNARAYYEENYTLDKHTNTLEKELLMLCKGQ